MWANDCGCDAYPATSAGPSGLLNAEGNGVFFLTLSDVIRKYYYPSRVLLLGQGVRYSLQNW